MKNVVIVSSSPRKGNSDKLCDYFENGAKETGNIVKRINIRELNLNFCRACSDCYNDKKCKQNDDMNTLYEDIVKANVLVFATPIYFGEMSGQLKTFIDRLYPIYQSIKVKEIYIIATCFQNSKDFINDSLNGIKRFARDIGINTITKIIYGENCDEQNDISPIQLDTAFNYGKEC